MKNERRTVASTMKFQLKRIERLTTWAVNKKQPCLNTNLNDHPVTKSIKSIRKLFLDIIVRQIILSFVCSWNSTVCHSHINADAKFWTIFFFIRTWKAKFIFKKSFKIQATTYSNNLCTHYAELVMKNQLENV